MGWQVSGIQPKAHKEVFLGATARTGAGYSIEVTKVEVVEGHGSRVRLALRQGGADIIRFFDMTPELFWSLVPLLNEIAADGGVS